MELVPEDAPVARWRRYDLHGHRQLEGLARDQTPGGTEARSPRPVGGGIVVDLDHDAYRPSHDPVDGGALGWWAVGEETTCNLDGL